MVSSVLMIIVGFIVIIGNWLAGGVSYAPQQTVQYLGYVCGVLLLVGGFICLKRKR